MEKNHRKASIVNSESSADRRFSLMAAKKGSRKSVFPGMANDKRHSVTVSRKSSQDMGYSFKVKMQNTYRIEPEEHEKFKPFKIEPKIYQILESNLKEQKYEHGKLEQLTKHLTQEIMRETRSSILSSRYKVVAHVAIGEIKDQDIRVASRCLWDNDKDNSASVVYKNGSIYAVATVFAIYFE